jgi:hypothetical protein
MNQSDNTPIILEPEPSSNPAPTGWIQTWIRAISLPSEQTFIDISESPAAQSRTAYLWIFIVSTLSVVVTGILKIFIMGVSGQSGSETGGSFICMFPFAGALSVLFFGLCVSIVQWIAKLLGGTGSYDKLAYVTSAFSTPIILAAMFVTPFFIAPYINIFAGLLGAVMVFYSLFLQVMAVKAVNRLGWGQAAGSVLIPGTAILAAYICILAIGFAAGISR